MNREKLNCRHFLVWNSHVQRDHVTMAIPDTAFSAVRFCSYTVRRIRSTIGLLGDRYASCPLVCEIHSRGLLFHRPFYTGLVLCQQATWFAVGGLM